MNRTIRKVERELAHHLSSEKWNRRQLENDLEWFITWAIKKPSKPDYYWCDGVRDLKLSRSSKRKLQLNAVVRIGSEKDLTSISEGTISGTIQLSSNGRMFKGYAFQIEDGAFTYEISKGS